MSIIGDKMRELRGSSSQREMADAIGIKYNAWARYEAGGALPGAEIIERICRIHACSADWLLGLKDNGGSVTIASGNGSIAVAGSGNKVSVKTKSAAPKDCEKCPYKKKLEKLEKMIAK
jgi:transcriptional regulator with XRE-family HTH domain